MLLGSRASLSRPFWRGVRKHSAPRGMVRKANAEATFEKRPRKQAEVAQHRELLPTKEADGSLKRHADGSQEWTRAAPAPGTAAPVWVGKGAQPRARGR